MKCTSVSISSISILHILYTERENFNMIRIRLKRRKEKQNGDFKGNNLINYILFDSTKQSQKHHKPQYSSTGIQFGT